MKKRIFTTFLIFAVVGIIMELCLSFIFSEVLGFSTIVALGLCEAFIYLIYCFIYSRKHVLIALLVFLLIMIALLVVAFIGSGESANDFFTMNWISLIIRVIYYQVASHVAEYQFDD